VPRFARMIGTERRRRDPGLIEDELTSTRPSILGYCSHAARVDRRSGATPPWGGPAPGFGLRRHLLPVEIATDE
jgi:hypothetical protein